MKLAGTALGGKRKYFAVMLFCFLYGGFSLILFAYQIYAIFWQSEIAGAPLSGERLNDLNRFGDFNRMGGMRGANGIGRISSNPLALMSAPNVIFYLVGGIVAIVAGLAIFSLMREKEIKHIKEEAASNLLLPDEKAVVDALKRANNELTQARIAKETGLSKVQVHRALKKLESRGLLEKHNYGLTNKIILKKEFFK